MQKVFIYGKQVYIPFLVPELADPPGGMNATAISNK